VADDSFQLSRRKLLASVGAVGGASAAAGLGTTALLSDQERFDGNRVVAGELDMRVAYESYYSTLRSGNVPVQREGGTVDNRTRVGLPGDANGTASVSVRNASRARAFLEDTRDASFPSGYDPLDPPADPCPNGLGDADNAPPAIELADVKPGDFGSVVFDFALCDNPGFVWLRGSLRDAAENGVTEPEADADAERDGVVELLDAVEAAVWTDDGDGVQDPNESLVASGTLRQVLNALTAGEGLGLAGDLDPTSVGGEGRNCFSTNTTHSVVLAWRVPTDVGNEIQSDRVVFDVGLYTEQCRNNAASRAGNGYLPQSKLFPQTGATDDEYGRAVAVDGQTALVGAPNGSVFVLERTDDGTWAQRTVLETGADADEFGTAVGIDGGTALISAPGANRAYVYRRGETNADWTQDAVLEPSNEPTSFGYEAVALDAESETAVVSGFDDAYVFDGLGGGTESTRLPTDDGLPAAGLALDGEMLLIGAPAVGNFRGSGPGKAYVYDLGGPSQQAVLEPEATGPAAFQDFGAAVAVTESVALVGAPRAGESGAVHVYDRDNSWTKVTSVTAPAAAGEAEVGRTVTATGTTALAGAPGDDGSVPESGAAYIISGEDGWAAPTTQQLVATDGAEGDRFGAGGALTVTGNTAFVGARAGDGAETDSGAVYLFTS